MDIMNLIQTLGFPIALVVILIWFIKDSIKHERVTSENREARLIEANKSLSESLDKTADTINNSNSVNKELSETNRLLVDKIEGKLENIYGNIEKVLEKIDK